MSAKDEPAALPKRWREVRLRDAGWLLRYSMRAVFELVRARRRFGALEIADLRARNADLAQDAGLEAHPDPLFVHKVAFIMPRIAQLMPFRSDCLIQSTGAQAWLAHYGVPSTIVIGVERPDDRPFGAHAWLEHDGMIVTGGDVSQYTVLL